jgi:hypothetical protein
MSIVRATIQVAVAESRESDDVLTRDDLDTLSHAAWEMFMDDMKEVAAPLIP